MNAKMYVTLVGVLLLILLIGLAILLQKRQASAQKNEEPSKSELELSAPQQDGVPENISEIINSEPPTTTTTMTIDTKKKYSAILETTAGAITIQFNTQVTPITVNNFITLARKDFYDGTIFHRVIEGFMIQGGDPRGDGTGGPGYKFADEKFTGEYTRGTVAMANSGPNTNGSQFFIMHADNPLPKNYVIFGVVTEGMDVVDAIATAEVSMSRSGEESQPVDPVKITNIKVVEE